MFVALSEIELIMVTQLNIIIPSMVHKKLACHRCGDIAGPNDLEYYALHLTNQTAFMSHRSPYLDNFPRLVLRDAALQLTSSQMHLTCLKR